jgi:hypothetical protein
MIRCLCNRKVERTICYDPNSYRQGVAAVEFALCLPLIVLLLMGLWEVGRIAQVANVIRNGGREAARDASLAQDNLQTVANNLAAYLQGSLPTTFGQGHSTTLKSPTISLPANTTGYMCWDNTVNQELFTLTFTDVTNPSITDPTGMQKLDHYRLSISVPYATIGWSGLAQITSISRISITLDWASMVDSPFQITPALPAQ